MRTIEKVRVNSKKILMRVDFNVPIEEIINSKSQISNKFSNHKFQITDDIRIRAAIPTIKYLLENGAKKIILVSHLGRPEGKIVSKLKLEPIAKHLAKLLNIKTAVTKEKLDGFNAYKITEKITLLENIRFYPEEEKNNRNFAKKLADLADIYVNEAFACSHRAHSSVVGVTQFLSSFGGLHLQKEVEMLSKLMKHPQKPFVCILGGAKFDKIEMIENLARVVDWFLLGGVTANTLLKAKGIDIKHSTVAREMLDTAKELLNKYSAKLILPSDLVFGEVDSKKLLADISDKDVEKFGEYIQTAKTIFWNGNLGITEDKRFENGSRQIAKKIIKSKAVSFVAGGNTIGFLKNEGLLDKFSFVSLAGGAALEFLAGKKLPGIEALK